MFGRDRTKEALLKKLNFNDKKLKSCSKLNQTELLTKFKDNQFGVKTTDVENLQKEYGYNKVDTTKFNWVLNFFKSFFGPFNLVLMAISVWNFYEFFSTPVAERGIADVLPAIIVAIMIFASGTVVYIQTIKAHFVTKKLISIVSNKAMVIRDIEGYGNINHDNMFELIKKGEDIDVRDLVPGDLVYLSSGDMVPADVRILVSRDLFINHASLTGESMPIEKHAITSNSNLLELENICLMGTSVVSGSAIAMVIQTGIKTYFSSISSALQEKRPLTNFQTGVQRVTFLLIMFVLIMAPIIYLIYSGTKNDWLGGLTWTAAAAVGIVPEMLPMIVTSNLARGARKMSRSKLVFKNLGAIQNLGAIDVLCTDKTGTLTNDKIELINYASLDNKKETNLLKLLYLNSYFQTGIKNPLDTAIIDHVKDSSHYFTPDKYQKIDEIPFDFERRRLTIIVKNEEETKLISKGAIEEIINVSNKIYYQNKIVDLDDEMKKQITSTVTRLNNQGYRVLGIGYKVVNDDKKAYSVSDEKDLIFYGYVTFLDVPKPSAAKMVKVLAARGVDLKILTGDNAAVTRSICDRVGMQIKGIISGEELDKLTDYELKRAVEINNVFVKLNPIEKSRIIALLKANNHVVGFMGDGINDVPVLRQSDIAISVNNATDVAKEASDIILLEKSLDVIEHGIEQGRLTFGNILKYIKITMASQFGNVFSLIVVAWWIPFTPMLPVQMLFQNLIYDFSQFAIVFDRVDKDFLLQPQRWRTKGMLSFTFVNGPISSVFDIITFVILGYGFGVFNAYAADPNSANAAYHVAIFQSGWFIEGLITQSVVMLMFRTKQIPFIQSRPTWPVNVSTALVMVLGFLIPYVFNNVFPMTAPPLVYIPIVLGVIAAYCITAQLSKVGYIKVVKNWL
ncbi:Mg(2+) transport ATPase, P-type [Spiroplasma sp. NBRC 100390]|uniref:magnesium-translocating P-type ATPase n=1 Tax=unclassified Spiroplasma TaxID=2637901 RepID=UPI000892A4A3|nr:MULTISPECIES: magnesium-translocating P-type ATPase [unclassified Spiroplasma]AOX44267.1 Mg(2+) transport ATPase, P-type [Spiroplasma sp. TU-14]APE13737.1 Mg(2+) transport ATPase, P-type [Spiroplasma sp. NBRC 100390]